MKKRGDNEARVLKPEQKALLHECIAQYLDRSGFSKTLNKFRKEAQFQQQNDGLGGSSFDLEDVFCKYLEICDKSDSNVIEKQSGAGDKHIGLKVADEEAVATDIKGEDKKRMKKNSDSLGTEEQGKADSAVPQSPAKKCKDKKKKKSKLDNESPDNTADHSLELLPGSVVEKSTNKKLPEGEKVTDSQIDNKPKNKKKKKNDLSLPEIISGGNLKDHDIEKPSQGIELDTSKDEVTDKKNKGSKKRKRLATEEDGAQHADEKAAEESKFKKTKRSEEQNGSSHFTKLKSASETNKNNQKEETGEVISRQSEKISTKKHDEPVNGNLEKSGKESSAQKTTKMQRNASVEPKTVNHFQRVKVEEVVFSDERLQDNSYWAKDGAENGYGAKAQEVLGQVKGRGFRHEKTKKKRGTYRGGEIDLHSHSVKFNYSDDE